MATLVLAILSHFHIPGPVPRSPIFKMRIRAELLKSLISWSWRRIVGCKAASKDFSGSSRLCDISLRVVGDFPSGGQRFPFGGSDISLRDISSIRPGSLVYSFHDLCDYLRFAQTIVSDFGARFPIGRSIGSFLSCVLYVKECYFTFSITPTLLFFYRPYFTFPTKG